MSCFNGTKYKERQVSFIGDPDNGTPSSIDYISGLAQKMADAKQVNYIVYERKSIIKGTYYDYEPKSMGREPYTKLIRFNKSVASADVLRDSGNGESESVEPAKQKSKSTKAKKPLGRDKGRVL